MKSLIREILRKLGLLAGWRKFIYWKKNLGYFIRFYGQTIYPVSFGELKVNFSVIDPYSKNFFGYYFNDQLYEEEELRMVMSKMTTDDIFVDVGSNIGYFTCLVAKRFTNAKVYSFEMGAENFDILKRNVMINGLSNVVTENAAVSDKNTFVNYHGGSIGSAVLKISTIENSKDLAKQDFKEIKALTLDGYFGSLKVKPTIIKIDVEGAEIMVLNGMKQILSQQELILFIEIHKRELIQFGSTVNEVEKLLLEHNFSIKVLDNGAKKYPVWYCEKVK